jgi:hypothetical protein
MALPQSMTVKPASARKPAVTMALREIKRARKAYLQSLGFSPHD